MRTNNNSAFMLPLGIAMLSMAASANAATGWTYNLSTKCDPGVNAGTHVAECNLSEPDLTLSGWSTGTGSTTTPTSGTTFQANALIYDWGSTNGLGVVSGNDSTGQYGPHALDNGYGIDALLLSFTNAVNMTNLNLGWTATQNPSQYVVSSTTTKYNDSDLSVYAWTGAGSPNMGTTTTALSGWTLIGDFSNATGSLSLVSSTYSSYWLVGAFNTGDITTTTTAGYYGKTTTTVNNVDAFKVLSVAGNNCSGATCGNRVPEPGSMMLLGLGLVGLMGLRRRFTLKQQ